MKTILIYLKGLMSFWPFALVILLMGATLFLAASSHFPLSFSAIQARIYVLDTLEGQVSADLSFMQLHEARAIFAYSYNLPAKEHLNKAAEAGESIRGQLSELAESGGLDADPDLYASDISALLSNFTTALDTHQKLFDQVLAAIDEGNDDETYAALDELESQSVELNDALKTLIVAVEQDRLAAFAAFPAEVNEGILYNSIGIAVCLLLSLVGYRVIASMAHPLRHVRNILTSIAGDQYRPSNYRNLLAHGDPGGNLARMLDKLAQQEQAHNAGSKQEIERLRQELYESRRRRLKLYREPEQVE